MDVYTHFYGYSYINLYTYADQYTYSGECYGLANQYTASTYSDFTSCISYLRAYCDSGSSVIYCHPYNNVGDFNR